jgi:hypothetical protein
MMIMDAINPTPVPTVDIFQMLLLHQFLFAF